MTERKKPQDHLPSKKKARTRDLWFITDFEKAEELEALKSQDDLAGLLGKNTEEARQAKIKELEDSLRKSSVKVTIRSLSRKRYDELITEHPPTEAQIEEYASQRQKPSFNTETYPVALVVESVIYPEASNEELEEWFASDDWTGGEFTELFSACINLNSQSNILSLGKE